MAEADRRCDPVKLLVGGSGVGVEDPEARPVALPELDVEPAEPAADAAVPDVALGAEESAKLFRDEGAEGEEGAVADVAGVAAGLLEIDPRAGFALVFEVGAAGAVEVVVELPGE